MGAQKQRLALSLTVAGGRASVRNLVIKALQEKCLSLLLYRFMVRLTNTSLVYVFNSGVETISGYTSCPVADQGPHGLLGELRRTTQLLIAKTYSLIINHL